MSPRFIDVYGQIAYPERITAEFRLRYPPITDVCEMPQCGYTDRAIYLARLVYDHCHLCGFIRGMLCGYHNRNLGRYEKNIPLFGSGNMEYDNYLARHTCVTL